MKKRLLAFILSVSMLLSLFPVAALAVNVPETTEGSYAEWKNALANKAQNEAGVALVSDELASGYIQNQYIEAYIAANGQYTMGTVGGDPNTTSDDDAKLLYGHPDPWSSETLIRIDGTDYWFHEYVTSVEFTSDTSCVATAEIDNLVVKQILTIETNPYTDLQDVISIRYTYENQSSASKQVGVRIMLDTMLGLNDGSPFRVNGRDVTTECEFSGGSVPQYWQSFDSLSDPSVTATGVFYYNSGERPDKVQFADWG